jgi:GT2 family glycosyltransferase
VGGVDVMVVPVLNRYDLLARLVGSIDFPVGRLVVVDNGGGLPDCFVPESEHVEAFSVWRMPSNLGVGPSWNLAIKATPWADGWLLVNSDVQLPPGFLEAFMAKVEPGTVVRTAQDWACVWIGSKVVEQVGLFSECFVPAYCEDNDYEWRCGLAAVPVVKSSLSVVHEGSSSIKADRLAFDGNQRSFPHNVAMFHKRVEEGMSRPGEWSLQRRRELGWDRP